MKISNSKKELARIISENGGWRDGAEFTAQDGDGTGSMDFFKSKPIYDKDYKYWKGEYDYQNRIKHADVTIKNFHQTILSREEYFHLYPAPDADGWIECNGSEPKIDQDAVVEVKFRDGQLGRNPETVRVWCWHHGDCDDDIIAYRLHKPEQQLAELCDKVTEENKHEHVDCKPTIEQLAADYRNRKGYADRKQGEADAAKDDADAKLEELIAAGKALRLVLSVEPEGSVNTPAHHPLIAGDWRSWRQWKVGDLISWSILGHIGELRIIAVHHDPSRNIGDFEVEDKQGGVYRVYGNECRFIRRP